MNPREIFQKVWRQDFSQPGYAVIDLGRVDSYSLRRAMVNLKRAFSEWVPFHYSWLMRFDQQNTSHFHKDGGPPQNMLILGYEPSPVKAKVFIADWPEYHFGRPMPSERVTELPSFPEGHSVILVLNNSHELGVWHRAEILNPDPTQPRIINSMQLVTDVLSTETLDPSHEAMWLETNGYYQANLFLMRPS